MSQNQNGCISTPEQKDCNCIKGRLRRPTGRRKGSTLVLGLFLVAGLLVVTAVGIDYAHINTSRTESKRTADAAAMSACWELFDGVVAQRSADSSQTAIASVAVDIAEKNLISSRPAHMHAHSDVELGFYDLSQPGQLDTSDTANFNAVRVHLRQTEARQAAVPLFFGAVTGKFNQSLEVHSTAAMFRGITGFSVPGSGDENLEILPFALDLGTWQSVVAKQTVDNVAFVNGQVVSGSDGYFECSLYPQGTGSPGNRGTVDIGGANNSTTDIVRQIRHGISAEDMAEFGRTLEFDATGELELTGDTGLSAGFKGALADIIGQPRIIPIFTRVIGTGDNAMYTIVRFEGIRILSVRLTGPMRRKHLTIQPCPMVGRLAKYKETNVTKSDFLYTPVMLVE